MSDRRVVADGSVTRIEVCRCGTCYVTIGPLTVALQRSAIEELEATIDRGLRVLRSEEALAGLSTRPGVESSSDQTEADGCVPGAPPVGAPDSN